MEKSNKTDRQQEKVQMRRVRNVVGFNVDHRIKSRRVVCHRPVKQPHTVFADIGIHTHESTRAYSDSSLFSRVLDSPHTASSDRRCDSPALFGLVSNLLKHLINGRDENGKIMINFYPEDALALNKIASCERLGEQELLDIVFPNIVQCGQLSNYQAIANDEDPVKLTDIIDCLIEYAQENNDKCVAVLSIQHYRYLIAKNGEIWIFGDLQNQSEQGHRKLGSHYVLVNLRESLVKQLENAWNQLRTVKQINVLDSEWGVAFYRAIDELSESDSEEESN